MAEEKSEAETAASSLKTLRAFNPFVVGLDDRKGIRQDHFQLFDGQSTLITIPMTNFDGFPLEREYHLFVPIVLLTTAAVLFPLVPLLLPLTLTQAGIVLAFGAAIGTAISVFTAFHLTRIGTDYSNANSNLQNQNFVTRAHGIRAIIHTFKRIVRWRRFMRYTMNSSYIALTLFGAMVIAWLIHLAPWHTPLPKFGAVLLYAMLSASVGFAFLIFEFGRKKYTEGMDPTLALVFMIEEIGGQLANRSTLFGGAHTE